MCGLDHCCPKRLEGALRRRVKPIGINVPSVEPSKSLGVLDSETSASSVGALYEDVNELRKREKTCHLVPLSALESVAVFQQNQFIHSLYERTLFRVEECAVIDRTYTLCEHTHSEPSS